LRPSPPSIDAGKNAIDAGKNAIDAGKKDRPDAFASARFRRTAAPETPSIAVLGSGNMLWMAASWHVRRR
jgi:hypothetical protein